MRQIIKIKNCNCISEANISIQEGELNINYGPNGTGKSSISEAIFAASQGNAERLGTLDVSNRSVNNVFTVLLLLLKKSP